jgi:hypothetical protein
MGGDMKTDDRREVAEYIASMCDELAKLADRNALPVGAYLLRVATLEFWNQQNLAIRSRAK